MAQVGAALSGNFRTGLVHDWDYDYYSTLPDYCSIRGIQSIDLSEALKNTVNEAITQDHHLFVNRHEVEVALKDASKEVRVLCTLVHLWLLRAGNNVRVTHITFMMYVILAGKLGRNMIFYYINNSDTEDEILLLMKLESQAAKQLQRYKRDDLSTIFEMQVLWNRLDKQVDWEKEVKNRTLPNSVDISPDVVKRIACSIFRDAEQQGYKPKEKKWSEYWATRWSSMPNGSVVSQYADDNELKSKLPREAKVKSAWFAALEKSNYDEWKLRQPMIYATTSTKYEWGKVRALYGCDVTSFLMADFSMADADECLPQQFPVGSKANGKYVKLLTSKMTNSVPFCFDYDDFNSQHSTRSMMAVIEAWIHIFGKYLNDDQKFAANWTLESITNMMVKFGALDRTVTLEGTLMSGWRLTSFMNTVLNRVYLEAADLVPNVVHALHNGDDMYACTLNVQNAVNILGKAKSMGIRAQAAKMNVGTIGEFLRIDARAKNPTGAQYLTRSVATMVHGRVEVGKPNDFFALIKATDVRYDEVEQRGGNKKVLARVKAHTVSFIKNLFSVEDEVLDYYYKLHPLQGGNRRDISAGDMRIVLKSEVVNTNTLMAKYSICSPGMVEYFSYIVNKYKLEKVIKSKKQFLVKAMLSLERQKIGYVLVNETRSMISNYVGLYQAWHKTVFVPEITKVRTAGLVAAKLLPNVHSTPAYLIRNAQEPIEFMKAIL